MQNEYFEETLPTPENIREALTRHAFEVESIERVRGDTLFDIKVLPDRSHDCLSHIGIAREIALLCGVKMKKGGASQEKKFSESNVFRVEVEDFEACSRFSTLVIEGVEVKESPTWLQERLEVIGQRSINNIVDITNYVMFSLGQPLHAYDRDRLKEGGEGWKIAVRKARNGEKVLALDDKEYSLNEEHLVIVDGNTDIPLGIAGVKGGKASEISHNTKNIILEAAHFNPVLVRSVAKKLGLRTDASVRFENAITPELTMSALNMAASLILDIANGENIQIEGFCDVYPKKPNPYKVGVSLSEIESTLGVSIGEKETESILNRRGYEWSYVTPREVICSLSEMFIGVPYKYGASVVYDSPKAFDCSSFSSFLYAQAGLAIPRVSIEQFLFGDEVSEGDLNPGDLVFAKGAKPYFFKEEPRGVGHVGIYLGDGQIIHAAGSAHGNHVLKENLRESDSFKNEVFRGFRKLIPNDEKRFVVTIPAERLDLRIKEDLIEEIGRIYGYENLTSKAIDLVSVKPEAHKKTHYEDKVRTFFVERGFSEVITYMFRESGEVELQNPLASDKKFLRDSLSSGLSEALVKNVRNVDLLGLQQVKLFEIGNVFEKDSEYTALAFCIGNSKEYKGERPQMESEMLIKDLGETLGAPAVFNKKGEIYELNFTKLLEVLPEVSQHLTHEVSQDLRYKEYSRYPAIFRDIAVFIGEGEDQEGIIDILKKESADLLVRHTLFDVFTKEFPEGKKTSYAYRLVFQSQNKTLTDEEINPIMERVTGILNNKKGWQVR